mgnify:CR=1 FL=1
MYYNVSLDPKKTCAVKFAPTTCNYCLLQAIVKTTETSGLRLNGQSLSVVWTPIAGTDYSHSEIPVDNGRTYNLMHTDSEARFLALLYGSADRESFYFPIDVGNININVSIIVVKLDKSYYISSFVDSICRTFISFAHS